MKRKLSKKAKRLVSDFQRAATSYAWCGRGEPEEDALLLPALLEAKSALIEYVNRMENELERRKGCESESRAQDTG